MSIESYLIDLSKTYTPNTLYEIVEEHKWMDKIEGAFPYGSVFQVDVVFSKLGQSCNSWW